METRSNHIRQRAGNPREVQPAASRGLATVEAIIQAAERLWGAHGVEGASLREISAAAGSANKSSIAYHFGDKFGLIQAICRSREPTIEVRRQALFATAKAEGKLGDPLTLLKIAFQPIFEEVDEHGRHTYAAFLRSVIRFPQFDGRAATQELAPTGYLVLDILREQVGHLPQILFDARLRVVNQICYAAITDQDDNRPGERSDPVLANKIFEDALSASVHLLFLGNDLIP